MSGYKLDIKCSTISLFTQNTEITFLFSGVPQISITRFNNHYFFIKLNLKYNLQQYQFLSHCTQHKKENPQTTTHKKCANYHTHHYKTRCFMKHPKKAVKYSKPSDTTNIHRVSHSHNAQLSNLRPLTK